LLLAAYAVPAAAIWAGLGLLLGALDAAAPPVAAAALVVAAGYGLGYGVIEASGRARPRAPGSNWQVPQRMLIGAGSGRRVLIWGFTLGPGFLTRNPYAGFGMAIVLLGCAGRPLTALLVGAGAGVAHGSGRALALLRDARMRATRVRATRVRAARVQAPEPFELLLTLLRWRMLDGFALLAVAGVAIVCCGFRFG
jgi:hypothetical protein